MEDSKIPEEVTKDESRCSASKAEANRLNASKSTGPKTERGKQAIKLNALKHGLCAEDVVVPQVDGPDGEKRFQVLVKKLRDSIGPRNPLEELIVGDLAYCRLRVLRAARYESRAHGREAYKKTESSSEVTVYELPSHEVMDLAQRYQNATMRQMERLLKQVDFIRTTGVSQDNRAVKKASQSEAAASKLAGKGVA